MKFLVIEDNEALNDAVVDALSGLGSSDSAYDGEYGYYLASNGSYDLIVLDLMLPKMSGRVEAILRRHNNNFKTTYSNGRVELDFAGKIFRVDGKDVKLSGKMYDILEYLIRNRNMIISKEQLFNRIWGFDSETIITVTEVYISNLRKLLDKYGLREHLRTIKSVGYMWSEDPAQEA